MKKLLMTIGLVVLIIATANGVIAAISDNPVGRTIQGVFPVMVNGSSLDKPAVVIDGTSYLPVRAVADALNLNVKFENSTVILESGTNDSQAPAKPEDRSAPGGPLNDLASILGMTASELQSSLKAGSTLEQIASSKGMTMDQLKETWLSKKKTELDNQVDQGKMTAEQAQEMLTRLSGMNLTQMGAGPGMGGGGSFGGPPSGDPEGTNQ